MTQLAGINLTAAQIMQLLAAAKGGNNRPFVKPRFGGIDAVGPWTGAGRNGLFTAPRTSNCYRDYKTDVVKAQAQLKGVEAACMSGLEGQESFLFCTNHESNAKRIVPCIQAMEKFMISHGMEGVFLIALPDGSTLNMFKKPGMLTQSMVDTWCEDVMIKGVLKPDGSRHPVCPHDATVMSWSAEALLNTCTMTFRQNLEREIPEAKRMGPKIFGCIMFSNYRPSLASTENLVTKLGNLKLTDFPAEDVSSFNAAAFPLIEEIQMSYMNPNQVPDLAAKALKGLTCGTDISFRLKVQALQMECDVHTFGGQMGNQKKDPMQLLESLELDWKCRCNLKQYGPALHLSSPAGKALLGSSQGSPSPTPAQAFQAHLEKAVQKALDSNPQMQKLGQQRDASSTTGNKTKDKPCYDCGSLEHLRGDPACPNPQRKPPGHGLSPEEAARINALAKDKLSQFEDLSTVPDGLTLKEGSKVVATYCSKCGRFSKGATMHSGDTHKGPIFAKPSTQSSGSGSASGSASTKKVSFAGLAGTTCLPTGSPPGGSIVPDPVPSPSPMATAPSLARGPVPSYDFGTMPTMDSDATALYQVASDDTDDNNLMALFAGLLN